MIVTLDGRRLTEDFGSACTLTTVLNRVHDGQADDRLVVSVAVNGQVLAGRDLDAGLTATLAADDQIDLESGDRHEIAATALREIASELTTVASLYPELADRLNGGQPADAIRQVGESLQVWHACRTSVVQCSGLVGRDLTELEFDGRSLRDCLAELVDKLRGLRDALEARDAVSLADLLRYEMPGLCTQWNETLTALAHDIEEQGAGHGESRRSHEPSRKQNH